MNNKSRQLVLSLLKKHNAFREYEDFCAPHYCGIPARILYSLSDEDLQEVQKIFREIKNKGTYNGT